MSESKTRSALWDLEGLGAGRLPVQYKVDKRGCCGRLAPAYTPIMEHPTASPHLSKLKNQNHNQLPMTHQEMEGPLSKSRQNSLKGTRASDVDVGSLQQKCKHPGMCRHLGTMAGPTCSPPSKVCHPHAWRSHPLCHQLLLEYKHSAKDFLTSRESLR